MENIAFRPAEPKDANTLFELKKAAYGDEFRTFHYAEHGYQDAVNDCDAVNPRDDGMFSRKWHDIFCSEHTGVWSLVIEADSKIIGQIVAFSGINFRDTYTEYDVDENTHVIFCIYVSPGYKNKGIGQMAME